MINMKKFVSVFGTNCVGKTTLARNLLMSDDCELSDELFSTSYFIEKKNNFGKYTLSKGGKFAFTGSYSSKNGGVILY